MKAGEWGGITIFNEVVGVGLIATATLSRDLKEMIVCAAP